MRWAVVVAGLVACGDAAGTGASSGAVASASAVPSASGGMSASAGAGPSVSTSAGASASASAGARASASVSASVRASSSAPRFVEGNLTCPVPPGMPDWSWRRVHRVVGLDEKAVILTLDVGARLPNLEKVLDVLHERDVRATVFLYTAELERSPKGPGIIRRMVADGHELANHTLSHKDLTTFDEDGVKHELESVERFVREVTKGEVTTRPYFREPMLATNDAVDEIEKHLCYRSIWFTVDVGDYVPKVTADKIVSNVLEKKGKPRRIESGSIFIFHGSQPENLVALPRVIDALRADGFSFLTLSEALGRSAESARGERPR